MKTGLERLWVLEKTLFAPVFMVVVSERVISVQRKLFLYNANMLISAGALERL